MFSKLHYSFCSLQILSPLNHVHTHTLTHFCDFLPWYTSVYTGTHSISGTEDLGHWWHLASSWERGRDILEKEKSKIDHHKPVREVTGEKKGDQKPTLRKGKEEVTQKSNNI